ncbi:pyridine nucleotide-disulfide oxidoreductase domain-containing protein 2-like [Zingiber officinale]|uniref:pyridine nucleotide-disulfide oxidoreductase domain-containing protein 2-like n=1 Tax=Zingiber officinale TaxID=94328 RepID=UPI001C4AEF64|nr:pyridine nucleotide-disulfide oxidoreductase domain-containing protein 2-like [Zingiber officinale]
MWRSAVAFAPWRMGRAFSSAAAAASSKKWDAVVIGGGHNGLTAAAYLARAGLSVAVLERRHVLGGAAVTEEIVPGFRFSRCSYLQSLLRPSIIRDLELARHGLKLLRRNPSSFTPCLDGKYLLLGPDADFNHSEIAKFSKKDALSFPRYEEQLKKFCGFMDYLLDSPTPEISHDHSSLMCQLKDKLRKSTFWGHLVQQTVTLGQKDMLDFMDLLLSPASKVLNNWFETEILKATLATDAVIGTTASVHTPGSGYVLLHHVMGETDGERGVWSYVEGGMGAVSKALSNSACESGAHIVTNAEVAHVMLDEATGMATGVALLDGTKIHASAVLSNATPYKTFVELVPPNILPEDFLCAIKNIDYSSATTKINLAVSRLPQFRCCNSNVLDPGPQHMGTIHIGSESMEEIDVASRDASNGIPSRRPIIEMTIPSVLDHTISPPGQHVINLFVQYTPYKLSEGTWQDPSIRESFAQRCFSLIDEYAPGFSSSIIGYDMLTPPDLEREFGLTGGNIFHGAMSLDSLFLMRPIKGWSGNRTPVKGLYLCGSGTHPGGGVMGAPGRNAASVVIEHLKSTKK